MKQFFLSFSIIKHIGKNALNIKVSCFLVLGCLLPYNQVKAQTLEQLFLSKSYKELTQKYGSSFRSMSVKDLILLSTAYDRQNEKEEQAKVLEQILKVKPKYFKVHYQLAEIHKEIAYAKIKSGKFYPEYEDNLNKMTAFYKSAMQLEPNNILPYRGMMGVIKDQENVHEGIGLSKEMLKIFKNTPETTMNLCYWNSKFGLVEQTRRSCQKAANLNPDKSEPFVLIARSYEDSGEKDKYNEQILGLLKRFPNDSEVIQRAGIIYYENKDYFNAERILQRNTDEDFEAAHMYLGFSLFQNEKYEESLSQLASSCGFIEDGKKDMLRFYEGSLRKLEDNPDQGLRFKFQRAVNNCKTLVLENPEIKVRAGHFEEGIRLPANAKSLTGSTLREKRNTYDMQRRKGGEFKPSASATKSSSGE